MGHEGRLSSRLCHTNGASIPDKVPDRKEAEEGHASVTITNEA